MNAVEETDPSRQHRFMVGPVRPGRTTADASEHWHSRHSKIVPGLPHLRGYVQNRPLSPWREQIPLLACAETWYETRDDEQESYASDYYRETIIPDEERFIDRSTSWTSVVEATEVREDERAGRLRVIAIGGDLAVLDRAPSGERVEVLRLLRPPCPDARTVLSVWTDDQRRAEELCGALGGLAFVCESVAVVPPPVGPWE